MFYDFASEWVGKLKKGVSHKRRSNTERRTYWVVFYDFASEWVGKLKKGVSHKRRSNTERRTYSPTVRNGLVACNGFLKGKTLVRPTHRSTFFRYFARIMHAGPVKAHFFRRP
jgi:hypothetical protein